MLDEKCIFCRIIKGEIPSEKVYEDDWMCVFKDVEPKAKVHLLAVPKTLFKLIEEAGDDDFIFIGGSSYIVADFLNCCI